ncbi:hypothetical protein [Carnobacterium sp. ISL-102]|nr:hypothetical protein [Carnobacterium sp. ISL-102]
METPAIKSQNITECILGVRKIFLQQKTAARFDLPKSLANG